MTYDYVLYRQFNEVEELQQMTALLQENGIQVQAGDNTLNFDVSFSNNRVNQHFEIRIKPTDFEKANSILESHTKELLGDAIPEAHYLLDFSDEELYDLLLKPDEWNEFDCIVAQNVLKQRGKSIDKSMIDSLRKQRIEDLEKPEESQSVWITAGYIISAIGGVLGIFIGYYIWQLKKTLPNGKRVFRYSEIDRKNGKILFFVSIVFSLFWLFLSLKLGYLD